MAELIFPTPPPSDGVVVLRPWTPADVDGAIMGFADPLVQRFSWPLRRSYTEADARAFYAMQEDDRRAGTALHFAIVAAHQAVGGGSLYDIDLVNRRASVGYWLSPAGRGRGLATRATCLAAELAFTRLGVIRLELTCAPDNLASQAVARRAGFTREALLRSHMAYKGGRRDTVVFSRLRASAG